MTPQQLRMAANFIHVLNMGEVEAYAERLDYDPKDFIYALIALNKMLNDEIDKSEDY